jgi:hypothetical protein
MKKLSAVKKEEEIRSNSSFSLYGKHAFYAILNLSENEKNKIKFINTVESMVRTSFEYTNYLQYLKKEAHLTYCSIINGLSEEDMKNISLEIHHYPFTLYDITEAVLNRHLFNELDFTRLSLANEVIDLHYMLQVGLIPLSLTIHQMAHTGNILLDLDNVFGNYEKFLEDYKLYISDEAKERYAVYFKNTRNKELIKQFNANKLEINKNLFLLENKSTTNTIQEEEIDEDF